MLRPVFPICHQLRSLSSVWTSTVAPRDDLVQKPCRNHEILPCHQQHIFHRSVSSLAKRCLFWRVCLELGDVAARLQLLHDLFRHSHWLEWTLEIPKNDYKFTLCIDVSVILATQWDRFESVIFCDINLKSGNNDFYYVLVLCTHVKIMFVVLFWVYIQDRASWKICLTTAGI